MTAGLLHLYIGSMYLCYNVLRYNSLFPFYHLLFGLSFRGSVQTSHLYKIVEEREINIFLLASMGNIILAG